MPQVVVFAKTVFAAWQAWAKAHVVLAFIIKTVAAIAITAGVGKLLGPKLGTGNLNGTSPLQVGRDPIAPRRIIYGETRVGGSLLDALVTGPKNELLFLAIAHAGHECEDLGALYLNDEVIPFDGGGNALGAYAGFALFNSHRGAPGQGADATFVATGLRANTDRFDSIAYTLARLTWDQNIFPGGIPNISRIVKGRKCFDPRTSTTAWTDNPALCIRDYLTNAQFGMGVDAGELDDSTFIAAANVCDEAVPLAAGGTEKRYRCNGSFETTSEPATVLEKLAESMAGMVIYVGGKWVCHAGAHRTPTITLDEDDLRAPITGLATKASMRDTCNRVRATFSSPDMNWQPDDIVPIVNGTYLDEDGGFEIWRDLDLTAFVTSHSQGQRLAKIELERTRQDITLPYPCKLTALRVQAGDVIRINNAELGWSGKLFLVVSLKFTTYDSNGELAMGVDLVLRETAAEVWDWNNGEETTYDPAPGTTLFNPRSVAAPSGLALTTRNFVQKDGTITPRLRVTWNAPADQFITSGGFVQIEYKKNADATWTVWNPKLRGDATEDFITDVQAGVFYDVRIRFENVQKVVGAYATASATVSLDTTAPAAPTGVLALPAPGSITLGWNENTEDDRDGYILYRNTSNNPITAVEIWRGTATGFTDFLAGTGTKYYWLSALDTTGNESPKSAVTSSLANPATGNFIDYVFKRAASLPATPTGNGLPSGWSDVPPAADGNPLWVSTAEKTSSDVLVGSWSTPIRLDGAAGAAGSPGSPGAAGDSIYVEYSVTGTGGWHDPFAPGDFYMRVKVGAGGTWSSAIKISGEIQPNEIVTIMIQNGAISLVSGAYTDGVTYTTNPAGGYEAVQWIGVTTDGSPVFVDFGLFWHAADNFDYTVYVNCDGADIWQGPKKSIIGDDGMAYPFMHQPGAGFHSYELRFAYPGAFYQVTAISKRTLRIFSLKR